MTCLEDKLELIKWQIYTLERTLVGLVDETEEGKYLLSITGLNYIAVAGLLAELGCLKCYRSAKQMIKMAGSNPTESESAGKRGAHTPIVFHLNVDTISRAYAIIHGGGKRPWPN